MPHWMLVGLLATAALTPADRAVAALPQTRVIKDLIQQLSAPDPVARARAACELREEGENAAEAVGTLLKLMADGSPVESSVCPQRWWRGGPQDLTSPGEQAAAALAAIGSRAFDPGMTALRQPAWNARRNAAWLLGALDDRRAVSALVDAMKDVEAPVREQAAWALGALDDSRAVPALMTALKDADARVRRQAAWALGAVDDRRAVAPLTTALGDEDPQVRKQAAWALGAIGDRGAVEGLVRVLTDSSGGVREQAAWALGAIGDERAMPGLLDALKDREPSVRRQAAWAIGAIGR